MDLVSLLAQCGAHRASDLHLTPGLPPLMRVNGDLQRLDLPALDPDDLEITLRAIMNHDAAQCFAAHHYCDFRLQADHTTHCRVHIHLQRLGMSAAFRLIPATPPTFELLGLPAGLRQIASSPHGLVLVTGASGSGKSSTLAAMLDYRNSVSPCHILTLEDPIEFIHVSRRALITQCELDSQTPDFSGRLKRALREDPDVIMIGEMRDPATIGLALEAAETGHLVLSTLHTRNARDAVARIVASAAPAAQDNLRLQLAQSLQAIISQALLKTADGQTRVLAYEILMATRAVRNLIRENRLAQLESLQQSGQQQGMHTLDQYLNQLVRTGRVSRDEANKHRFTHSCGEN